MLVLQRSANQSITVLRDNGKRKVFIISFIKERDLSKNTDIQPLYRMDVISPSGELYYRVRFDGFSVTSIHPKYRSFYPRLILTVEDDSDKSFFEIVINRASDRSIEVGLYDINQTFIFKRSELDKENDSAKESDSGSSV